MDLGHLVAQGYGDTKGIDMINFMSLDKIPNILADQTTTFARILIDYREQKEDPNWVRIMVGENLIEYPYKLTMRTADLTTSNVTWNSVISTLQARYICADVKKIYLCTPLDRYEYM